VTGTLAERAPRHPDGKGRRYSRRSRSGLRLANQQTSTGDFMKKQLCLIALGLSLTMGLAHAADADGKTAQQNKMGDCNKQAADKKGDERKAFMKSCLSAKPAATSQQDKMKTCNADAKGMKGDERKAFMSKCLKK
jgi:hypothetical protein